MSYTALYRKFRPTTFEDVKGQEHIVTTLKNQIKAQRIGHAYLFCGTRGTGKTTIAKIFARSVNCENPSDGSPCGECAMCRSIAAGTSMNVIEIDAASNNGVDNIREIVDEVSYSPAEGKYKVYILLSTKNYRLHKCFVFRVWFYAPKFFGIMTGKGLFYLVVNSIVAYTTTAKGDKYTFSMRYLFGQLGYHAFAKYYLGRVLKFKIIHSLLCFCVYL